MSRSVPETNHTEVAFSHLKRSTVHANARVHWAVHANLCAHWGVHANPHAQLERRMGTISLTKWSPHAVEKIRTRHGHWAGDVTVAPLFKVEKSFLNTHRASAGTTHAESGLFQPEPSLPLIAVRRFHKHSTPTLKRSGRQRHHRQGGVLMASPDYFNHVRTAPAHASHFHIAVMLWIKLPGKPRGSTLQKTRLVIPTKVTQH